MYHIVYWLAYAILFIRYRFKFIGREKLPEGAVLLCGNHPSLADPLLVVLALGPKLCYGVMAKEELFTNPVLGPFLRWIGVFPVKRGAGDVSAIKAAFQTLKNGKRLIIFPEGRRVREGETADFKSGAGMIALRTGATVIPVYTSSRKPLFKRTKVVFGDPYVPDRPDRPTAQDYQDCTDDIMARIFAIKSQVEGP